MLNTPLHTCTWLQYNICTQYAFGFGLRASPLTSFHCRASTSPPFRAPPFGYQFIHFFFRTCLHSTHFKVSTPIRLQSLPHTPFPPPFDHHNDTRLSLQNVCLDRPNNHFYDGIYDIKCRTIMMYAALSMCHILWYVETPVWKGKKGNFQSFIDVNGDRWRIRPFFGIFSEMTACGDFEWFEDISRGEYRGNV